MLVEILQMFTMHNLPHRAQVGPYPNWPSCSMCSQAGKGRQRKVGAHVKELVACSSFRCEKVKAK